MKAALHAVGWEIVWKNRLVFAALALLLAVGWATTSALGRAAPGAWWLEQVRNLTVVSFLASMVLGGAPFLLMESHGGWRMNSMVTRWFVLPVGTGALVWLPLAVASVFLAALVGVWMPVLNGLGPGFDGVYFGAVLVTGMAAAQTLAWVVPRKPGQFWVGVTLLFPVVLILALGPQDQPASLHFRRAMLIPLAVLTALLGGFACYAAQRNRCGDWPGELPLDRLWQRLRQGVFRTSRRRGFGSSQTALFWSDGLPSLRLLLLSWLALAIVLFLFFSPQYRSRFSGTAFTVRMLGFLAVNVLPVFGILWLAVWGLFVGCEPAAGFRTRLSSFRGTLPVSCGTLAAQRLVTLGLGWGIIWLFPVAMCSTFDPAWAGFDAREGVAALQTMLARWIAIGTQVVVGALPFILWGRVEGFPNLLLAAACSWAGAWLVGANLRVENDPGWYWALAGSALALKFGVAAWAFGSGLRARHIGWRFPVGVLLAWLAVAAFLVVVMPTWRRDGPYASLTVLVLLPVARLAWCPLAVAANRHR